MGDQYVASCQEQASSHQLSHQSERSKWLRLYLTVFAVLLVLASGKPVESGGENTVVSDQAAVESSTKKKVADDRASAGQEVAWLGTRIPLLFLASAAPVFAALFTWGYFYEQRCALTYSRYLLELNRVLSGEDLDAKEKPERKEKSEKPPIPSADSSRAMVAFEANEARWSVAPHVVLFVVPWVLVSLLAMTRLSDVGTGELASCIFVAVMGGSCQAFAICSWWTEYCAWREELGECARDRGYRGIQRLSKNADRE